MASVSRAQSHGCLDQAFDEMCQERMTDDGQHQVQLDFLLLPLGAKIMQAYPLVPLYPPQGWCG